MRSALLLVTAHHLGDLHYLPRLYTTLSRLRSGFDGQVFALDTGCAWSEKAWVCRITQNRAPYLVMDAMGYYAAFTDGLDAIQRARLAPMAQMRLVTPGERLLLTLNDDVVEISVDGDLSEPRFQDAAILLDLPPKDTVRQIVLRKASVVETVLAKVDHRVLPDPTITASVEFVESEARYYERTRG